MNTIHKKGRLALGLLGASSGLALLVSPVLAADGPFIVNYAQPPATLDPAFVCDIADNGFVSSLYAQLLRYEAKPAAAAPDGVSVSTEDPTNIVGYAADSYAVSEDGKSITLKLREGMKFSSGNPIDADAVKASIDYALSSGGCGAYFLSVGKFGSVAATDAATVTVTLTEPEPLMLHVLTQPNLSIVDVKTVEANGGKDWLASHAAGSGPYLLEDYQPGVRAVFKANPDFFGTPAIEPEVIVNIVTDNATLLLQARNAQADVTLGLSKASVNSLRDQAGVKIAEVPTSRWQLISLPNKQPPFDNVKFREALSYAIPYDAILNNVAHGFGQTFFGPYPPDFGAYKADLGAARAYDLEKAKALLAESGVATPVAAEIIIREGQNDQEQIATIAQAAWSQLGVNLSIRKLPASGYQEAIGAETKTAAIVRFDGPSVTDPAWLLDYDIRCGSLYNTSNYCNEEMDALLAKGRASLDPAERQAIWDDIARLWVAEAPRIPVYADVYTAVLSDRVTQWHFDQDGPFALQFWGR